MMNNAKNGIMLTTTLTSILEMKTTLSFNRKRLMHFIAPKKSKNAIITLVV